MEAEVAHAVERSFLAQLPPEIVDDLLRGAPLEHITAGETTYRAGADPRMFLIVSGLFRTYMLGGDGRQATVRYVKQGDVLGVVSAFQGAAPLHVQALTDAERVQIDVDAFRELARTDTRVGWALMSELTATIYALWDELAVAAFATVPQRVARHLLEFAAREQEASGGALVARVSQQELADLAGTVREVVARTLRELRDAGVVRVSRSGITVVDAAALAARGWPQPGSALPG